MEVLHLPRWSNSAAVCTQQCCAHNSAAMRTEQEKTKGSNRRGRRQEGGWRRRPRRARAVAASFRLSSRRCRRICLLLPLLILQDATTHKKQERRRQTGRQVEATRQVGADKTGHRQDRTPHQPSRQTDSRSVISSPLPGARLLYQGFGRLTGGKLLSEEDRKLAFVEVPVCRQALARCPSLKLLSQYVHDVQGALTQLHRPRTCPWRQSLRGVRPPAPDSRSTALLGTVTQHTCIAQGGGGLPDVARA